MQGHRVESRDQGAAEGRLPLLRRVVGVVFIFVPLFPVWPRGAVQASHEPLVDNPRSETPGAATMEGKRLTVSLKGFPMKDTPARPTKSVAGVEGVHCAPRRRLEIAC